MNLCNSCKVTPNAYVATTEDGFCIHCGREVSRETVSEKRPDLVYGTGTAETPRGTINLVEPDVSRQDHYTGHAIQPIEYIVGNGMDFLAGNVVKYVTRYKAKNGIEDLKKARVYLDWLIEREESGTITAHK